MVDIRPFSGIRYSKKVGDIGSVVTPPYDVISLKEQENLYKQNEYNCIRLDLGKEYPEDNESNNKYTRASSFFREWISEGVLDGDVDESIYLYRQDFSLSDGSHYSRKGFISLLKIEDAEKGNVKPHERTLSKPKKDRLSLIRECEAYFSPIFGLYDGKNTQINEKLNGIMDGNDPVIHFTDAEGIGHLLWRISDRGVIDTIGKEMEERTLFIADGHHRYETAKNYRDEMIEKGSTWTGEEPYNFVMTMFVDLHEKGLVILPIHRGIKNPSIDEEEMLSTLSCFFDYEELKFGNHNEKRICKTHLKNMLDDSHKKNETAFGIYTGGSSFYFVKVKRDDILKDYLDREDFTIYGDFDVVVLQKIIFEELFNLSEEEIKKGEHVLFINNEIEEAFERVDSGECSVVFILNPTKINQVLHVASKNKVVPQKTTFFYPKLLNGLVMYDLKSD